MMQTMEKKKLSLIKKKKKYLILKKYRVLKQAIKNQ